MTDTAAVRGTMPVVPPLPVSNSVVSVRSCLRMLGLAVLLAACSSPPKQPTPQAAQLRGFSAPPDIVLDVACTPTGLETCFDAVDNNCNGAIDEGCGVRTGVVQFSIAWSDPTADVDLAVTDPAGELARVQDTTALGLVKDRDCPGENDVCHGQNTENVYLIHRRVPRGSYRVVIRLNRLGQTTPPLRVQLGARVGQRSYATEIELEAVDDERQLTFEM